MGEKLGKSADGKRVHIWYDAIRHEDETDVVEVLVCEMMKMSNHTVVVQMHVVIGYVGVMVSGLGLCEGCVARSGYEPLNSPVIFISIQASPCQ